MHLFGLRKAVGMNSSIAYRVAPNTYMRWCPRRTQQVASHFQVRDERATADAVSRSGNYGRQFLQLFNMTLATAF